MALPLAPPRVVQRHDSRHHQASAVQTEANVHQRSANGATHRNVDQPAAGGQHGRGDEQVANRTMDCGPAIAQR